MKKVIFNVCLLTVLAVPCLLVFSDSLALFGLGIIYTIGYTKNIIIPLWRLLCKC